MQSADAARPSGSGRSGVRRRLRRRSRRGPPAPGDPRNIGWLYVLPGLAFYGLFTLAPLLHTVYYSLFSWDGLTAKTYVGLQNYSSALTDAALRSSFVHSAVLIAFYAVIPVLVGLLLTAALTRHPVRGFRFFRTALFLPQLIAGVVIAQAWTWIYDDNGPLNWALRKVGLGSLARPWLGDLTLYDAARVDGAGATREFFAVTLPGLRGEVLVALVLTTINALRSFDIVYNTTAGGPGGSTLVPSMYMYQNAFLYNKVGYAAAVATILAVTIFILAGLVLRVGDRSERA